MNWRTTGILVGLAAVLFAFIFFFERHTKTGPQPLPRLVTFRAAEVTNIQLRITNQLALRVERAGALAPWVLTVPIYYPAHPHRIQWMVEVLETLVSDVEISESELKSSKRSIAEFGLDVPRATLTLQHNGRRTEVQFGARTPVGYGVYIQTSERPGIYVVPGELADRLPANHNDWRDTKLFASASFIDRLDLKSGGRTVTLEIDRTNEVFVLSKPTAARADPSKVAALFQKLLSVDVSKFVTDSPRLDLEQYGLQPPEAEVSLLLGTNEQFTVQFGKSPPNEVTNVYARRLAQTNIVVVPRAALEAALTSHSDLRDLHLLSFNPAQVDIIEVASTNGFTVRRQTNGTWMITEPKPELADTNAIRDWLDLLAKLEGTIEKDVVTDFTTTYGLATPSRRYLLKSVGTNSTGAVTNRLIAELDLGNVQDKKVFARRPDEATVYGLAQDDVAKLPRRSWQLRDRRVWSFTTNQVHRLTLRHKGRTRTLQRAPNATWSIVEGSGVVEAVNPALEHAMERLGELRASVWVDQGDTNKALYGFSANSDRIAIELKNGEKPQLRVLEIGLPGFSPIGLPYGLTTADGQSWVIELPPSLWFENIVRDLFNPMAGPNPE